MSECYNIAAALAEMAERAPYRPGIIFPAGRDAQGRAKTVQLSFSQLNAQVDAYAYGLRDYGILQGERVLLLIHPGVELIAVVFALVKMGAVPVLIDPGMGRHAFLQCVEEIEAAALIGIPTAHVLRRLFPRTFRMVKRAIIVGGPGSKNVRPLRSVLSTRRDPFVVAPTTTESEAAVAFTSGSTGIPKGVVYLHGMFKAQVALLRNDMAIQEGEVDLALLYIFALFNPALGTTTVIPDMDPTKSAEINPAYVVESIQTHGVTNAFGSPTIWKRVAPYCKEHNIRLPSLKRIIMAGAPVPPDLIQMCFDHFLDASATVNTPFGATEAMPLTLMDGREIVSETAALTEQGRGMCVGRPLSGIDLRVIRVSDAPIPVWDEERLLPQGEIGEIVVKGPVVTRLYLNRPEMTALAKIQDHDGVWHRMGDTGYFDAQGRLWFCGRKSHRVETKSGVLFPVLCETVFNQHPRVARCAVVGVGPRGQQQPVLVVETRSAMQGASLLDRQRVTLELLAMATEHTLTSSIKTVLFHDAVFPTDVRHNAKIQREKLAIWAEKQLARSAWPLDSTSARLETREVSADDKTAAVLRVLGVLLGVFLSIVLLKRRWPAKRAEPEDQA